MIRRLLSRLIHAIHATCPPRLTCGGHQLPRGALTMPKFRKKPVEIEAQRVTPENVDEVAAWCGGRVIHDAKPSDPTDVYTALEIPTLEGVMRAETYHGGDWVIRGVKGEFYPCKPAAFADTFDPVEEH